MQSLQFEDGGRTFTCTTGSSPATPGMLWWWVSVTGELQRWAAFRAQPDDTRATVRERVSEYYAKVLADRARPRHTGSWSHRRATTDAAPDAVPEATPTAPTT